MGDKRQETEAKGVQRALSAQEAAEWLNQPNEPPEEAAGGQNEVSALSFAELYELYATDVLRMCYFYLGDRQRAEDVCQDVFVKLISTNPVLRAGREKAWLLKVALNRCKDLWRGSWLKRVVLGSPVFELVPAPDEIGEMQEEEAVLSAVNSLPAAFREVVLLHYYEGYGITEISEILHIPEGTISSRLSRARQKLQALLTEDGEERGASVK